MEIRDGLGVAEKEQPRVICLGCGGAKKAEEAAETARAEEGEVRLGIAQARPQRQCHLPVQTPPRQRIHQLPAAATATASLIRTRRRRPIPSCRVSILPTHPRRLRPPATSAPPSSSPFFTALVFCFPVLPLAHDEKDRQLIFFKEPTAHQGPEKPNGVPRTSGVVTGELLPPPRAAAKTLKTPIRRRRGGGEGGGGDGDAGEGRGAAVDKEVRGGGAVPAAVPEGVDAAGGAGGGGRLPRQPEAGVQVGGGRLRPPHAAE